MSITPLNNGLERELTVAWEPVSPTPEKYKIIVTMEGNHENAGTPVKLVLEKDSKNSSGDIIDTSISVNIQDYTGEIDITIYTVDSQGNLDLIYY